MCFLIATNRLEHLIFAEVDKKYMDNHPIPKKPRPQSAKARNRRVPPRRHKQQSIEEGINDEIPEDEEEDEEEVDVIHLLLNFFYG